MPIFQHHYFAHFGKDREISTAKIHVFFFSEILTPTTVGLIEKGLSFTRKNTHMWRKWGTPQNFFLAFTDELWKPEKSYSWKKEKKLLETIILHMCTENYNHMRSNSWDAEWERPIFLPLWAIFWAFTPLTTQKIKTFKNWKKTTTTKKKHLDISSFNTSETKNDDHMLYCSWDMAHDRCNFYFSFWTFFSPFTH